ncbi:hypothetical protein [Roseomonas sp. HF4]|uniref:hypothetical protein n=1 Tax=Roseomonas sp. HF4 TaxID=2562313 RepID=UPI0010C1473F|nr:hypothetical protein [Roseomonas sp. HF4]
MLVLPIVILLQVLPPPLGMMMTARMFGATAHTDVILSIPAPAPAEDCNCGIPSSPRGPR